MPFSLKGPYQAYFAPAKATVIVGGIVLLSVLPLELFRRVQLGGLPWLSQPPVMESIYLRSLLLFVTGLVLWLTLEMVRKPTAVTRPAWLPVGFMGYSLLVVYAAIVLKFLAPWVEQSVGTFMVVARVLSLPLVAFVLAMFVQQYSEIQQRLSQAATLTDELYVYSTTDVLTSLPNRYLFTDRLTNALERCKRSSDGLAVLAVNIDRFKLVNDSLGHAAGDEVLVEAGRRFSAAVRKTDSVCRMGSDTFLAFTSDLLSPTRDVTQTAERFLEEMSRPIKLGTREVSLTLSIGVSMCPNDGVSVEELVMNAERAMARAKERGSNQFVFYQPELNQAAIRRLTVENELRKALQRDELTIHYQPKIHTQTGDITGAEALVRWRHPDRGLVSPAEFIPIAEETRLIIPLDRWVLRNACLQAKTWEQRGLKDFRVSVNVSARHFQAEDLVEAITSELKLTGLSPRLLELEITESVMMANLEAAAKTLSRIKALGVHISLDDFGTGHSSLAYLKRFPVDCLKIDRSLISDGNDERDAALAKAIVSLGHSFGLEVIAEGVETEAQRAFLKGAGCDGMQGFLFSRPVPVADFEHLLQQRGMASVTTSVKPTVETAEAKT